MKILTDNERTSLLTKLGEAPDDILLEAVARMKEYYVNVKDDMKALNGFVGIRFTEAPKVDISALPPAKPLAAAEKEPAPAKPADIAPPGPAAQRITTASKEAIMAKLVKPSSAEDVNKFLQRGAGKLGETKMLLRRLWDLKLVTYDGANYGARR